MATMSVIGRSLLFVALWFRPSLLVLLPILGRSGMVAIALVVTVKWQGFDFRSDDLICSRALICESERFGDVTITPNDG